MEHRECVDCKKLLTLDNFYFSNGYYYSKCKACQSQYLKARYKPTGKKKGRPCKNIIVM